MTRTRKPPFVHLLGDTLILQLEHVQPGVRRMVEHLVSSNAAARLLGLDGVHGQVLQRNGLAPTAPQALPFLLALAEARGYPHAAALLARLGAALEAIDDPPRTLSPPGAAAAVGPAVLQVWALFEQHVPRLLRVAKSSRDPEAARAAARIVTHFPRADPELTALLVALLSGAQDDTGRSQLLYALAHIHGARAEALHPLVARALDGPRASIDKASVALALAQHDLEPSLRVRVIDALEQLVEAGEPARRWHDPRSWGARYVPAAAADALAHLRHLP